MKNATVLTKLVIFVYGEHCRVGPCEDVSGNARWPRSHAGESAIGCFWLIAEPTDNVFVKFLIQWSLPGQREKSW